jgi:hypothetical protein
VALAVGQKYQSAANRDSFVLIQLKGGRATGAKYINLNKLFCLN